MLPNSTQPGYDVETFCSPGEPVDLSDISSLHDAPESEAEVLPFPQLTEAARAELRRKLAAPKTEAQKAASLSWVGPY